MRKIIFVVFLCSLTFCVYGQSSTASNQTVSPNGYVRPNADQRLKKYIKRTFGPNALISPLISSTFKQIGNRPEEWGGKYPGFARRLGDSFGRNIIRQTVTYGLDEALKVDSNFYKSQKRDFKSKVSNAFLSSFTARNTQGKRVLGIPVIVGSYSSSIIADEAWMPKRFGYKDGLRSGTLSFATRIGFNLLREFVFK